MPIRYMGTKRVLADDVCRAIAELDPDGPVVDLFSGMGAVASTLAPSTSVITNDLLQFTAAFARARFLDRRRKSASEVLAALFPHFVSQRSRLRERFARRVAMEAKAVATSREALARWIASAPHAGRSAHYREATATASASSDWDRFSLTVLYFSAGYFSTPQAIEIDALRFAIEQLAVRARERDWLLAAWLSAAGTVANAPGHTAQFLKPRHDEVHARLKRSWERSVWAAFVDQLRALERPLGTVSWRRGNTVVVSDALEFLASDDAARAGVIYADPPYTKDQYSRYYHVYETLYLYDFPASTGEGRMRDGRSSSSFCLVSEVEHAFRELLMRTAKLKVPLVLSYPAAGLLGARSLDTVDVIPEYFKSFTVKAISHQHSTMGASTGTGRVDATERIHVCIP